MSYSFGNVPTQSTPATPTPTPPSNDQKPTTNNGCLDAILNALGLTMLAILLMVASCTYMAWDAAKRAHDILTIPDRLFGEGQIDDAVQQYKQVFPELVTDEQREKVLRRIISHEFGKGNKEEAAFWSDIAAEEGFDLTDSVGVEGSELQTLIRNAVRRHRDRHKKLKE